MLVLDLRRVEFQLLALCGCWSVAVKPAAAVATVVAAVSAAAVASALSACSRAASSGDIVIPDMKLMNRSP